MEKQKRAQRRKYHYIYKTTCQVNGKFYYGMHSTDDLEDGYIGSGTHLWHSIKKYGRENFTIDIQEFCENREALKKREAELVNEEILTDPMCMNLKIGGEGGFRLTKEQYSARNSKCGLKNAEKIRNDPEHHRKFSERRKETNKKLLAEQNKRLNPERNKRVHLGAKRSDECKKKISEKLSGVNNGMFGKVWIFNLLLCSSKRVNSDEIARHLEDGWQLGRKIKFISSDNSKI